MGLFWGSGLVVLVLLLGSRVINFFLYRLFVLGFYCYQYMGYSSSMAPWYPGYALLRFEGLTRHVMQ